MKSLKKRESKTRKQWLYLLGVIAVYLLVLVVGSRIGLVPVDYKTSIGICLPAYSKTCEGPRGKYKDGCFCSLFGMTTYD